MKTVIYRMGFSRRESLLGLAVMAVAVALVLPLMKADLGAEQVQRARIQAQAVAQAVIDYNADTGGWPRTHDGQVELSALLGEKEPAGTAPLVGSLVAADREAPWLAEEPRDPWNRPFLVLMPEGGDGSRTPRAVIVVSPGPDGRLETLPEQLESLCRNGRLPAGPLASGDDVGYLLAGPAGEPGS